MVRKSVTPSKWALVIAQNFAACTYHKNRKKDKILLSHGATGVRRVQISNKIDRSTYLALIKGVTTIFRKAWSNGFKIMITVFARKNILWYAYFLHCLFSFYSKKCRTQFRTHARPNVTLNGRFFHLQISTLWGNKTEETAVIHESTHIFSI